MRSFPTISGLAIAAGVCLAFYTPPAEAAVLTVGNVNFYGGSVCADVSGNSNVSGTPVIAEACNVAPNEQFYWNENTIFTESGQLCLGAQSINVGSKIVSETCNFSSRLQMWSYVGGHIVPLNVLTVCVDAGNAANGTQLILNKCSGSASQLWQIK